MCGFFIDIHHIRFPVIVCTVNILKNMLSNMLVSDCFLVFVFQLLMALSPLFNAWAGKVSTIKGLEFTSGMENVHAIKMHMRLVFPAMETS